MSNYPPGVTGYEYAINGPDWEGEVDRECRQKGVTATVAPVDLVEALNDLVDKKDKPSAAHALRYVLDLLTPPQAAWIPVELDECQFTGDVEASSYNGVLWWTCPMCGAEHEEELYDE